MIGDLRDRISCCLLRAFDCLFVDSLSNQKKEDEDTLDDVSSRAEDIRTTMDWNYNIENRVEKIGITNVKVIIEIMIEIWIIKNIGVVIEHVGIIEMEIESRITFIEVEIRVKVI